LHTTKAPSVKQYYSEVVLDQACRARVSVHKHAGLHASPAHVPLIAAASACPAKSVNHGIEQQIGTVSDVVLQ
jgi:hypothetical protein